jgi:MFS family permease
MASDLDTRPDTHSDSGPDVSFGRLLGVLVLAVLGFAVQQTAIVPAVQTVQQSLGGSAEWSAWLVTVYLIVATVATPAMGRLADLHGRKRILLVGLAIFVAGSVAAAFAPSMPFLIVCRAVQGVGGAVYPLSLAIARAVLPKERLTTSIAVLTGAFGVGTAVGFVGGGLLAEYASWRWIFAAGAILVAVGTVVAWRTLPDTGEHAGGSFDIFGTAVLTVSVVGLLTAITLVVPLGWASPVTIALFVVAIAAFVGWLRLEMRRDDPLIDIHVLREPSVAVANIATVGLGWALFSSYLLVPQFAETSPGHTGYGLAASVVAVGLIMLPLAVGQTAAGSTAGWLSGRLGARVVFAGGLAAVALALGLMAIVHEGALQTALLLLLLGTGAGAALETSSDVATQGVGDDVAGVSSSVNSTLRRLAGGIGGQVSTILLASLVLSGSGEPSHTAYVVAFLIAAGASLLGGGVVATRRTG